MRRAAVLLTAALVLGAPGPAFADHDYGGGYRDDYGSDWSNEDENRNRGRDRGAFSPGPFRDSPIEMHDVCVSLDCSGREKKDEPPTNE